MIEAAQYLSAFAQTLPCPQINEVQLLQMVMADDLPCYFDWNDPVALVRVYFDERDIHHYRWISVRD